MKAVVSMSSMLVGDDDGSVLSMFVYGRKTRRPITKAYDVNMECLSLERLEVPSRLYWRQTSCARLHLFRGKGSTLLGDSESQSAVERPRGTIMPDLGDLDTVMLYPRALTKRTKRSGDRLTDYTPSVTVIYR